MELLILLMKEFVAPENNPPAGMDMLEKKLFYILTHYINAKQRRVNFTVTIKVEEEQFKYLASLNPRFVEVTHANVY